MGTYLAVALSGELRHFYDGSCSYPLARDSRKGSGAVREVHDRVGD
jgi:hypothetical protein